MAITYFDPRKFAHKLIRLFDEYFIRFGSQPDSESR
jgi:hypothetical protein